MPVCFKCEKSGTLKVVDSNVLGKKKPGPFFDALGNRSELSKIYLCEKCLQAEKHINGVEKEND
jgi:hypothetical protein